MWLGRWIILIGGLFLLVGLACSLGSTYFQVKAMGEARKGVAILAPPLGSPEMGEKERQVTRSDWFFYIGLGLTAVGVILQTIGAIVPPIAPAAPAAPAALPPPPLPDVVWRTYELEVNLYRDYLALTLKANAFYYVGVGAVLFFFSTHTKTPLVWLPLAFLMVLGLALAALLVYGAIASQVTRQHIFVLAAQLGLVVAPEARVLSVLLWLTAGLALLSTFGISIVVLWWVLTGGG